RVRQRARPSRRDGADAGVVRGVRCVARPLVWNRSGLDARVRFVRSGGHGPAYLLLVPGEDRGRRGGETVDAHPEVEREIATDLVKRAMMVAPVVVLVAGLIDG